MPAIKSALIFTLLLCGCASHRYTVYIPVPPQGVQFSEYMKSCAGAMKRAEQVEKKYQTQLKRQGLKAPSYQVKAKVVPVWDDTVESKVCTVRLQIEGTVNTAMRRKIEGYNAAH